MRRGAGAPAFPGKLDTDSPSSLPSPARPVGQKRTHTSRHDSRQWSVGSSTASKSRQTSAASESASRQASLVPAVSPTALPIRHHEAHYMSVTSASKSRKASPIVAASPPARRQSSSTVAVTPAALPVASGPKQKEKMTNALESPPLSSSQSEAVAEFRASKHEPSLGRLQRERDLLARLSKGTAATTSRTVQKTPGAERERGSAIPALNSTTQNGKALQRTHRIRLARPVNLKPKDHALQAYIDEIKVEEDCAPGPDFMSLSSGSSDQANETSDTKPELKVEAKQETPEVEPNELPNKTPDVERSLIDSERVGQSLQILNDILSPGPMPREIDFERAQQCHQSLNEILDGADEILQRTARHDRWASASCASSPDQINTSVHRSRSLCIPRNSVDGQRPAWMNIGHFRNASWPVEERKRSLSESPRPRVRSMDVERGTGIFPHRPIRASLDARVARRDQENRPHIERDYVHVLPPRVHNQGKQTESEYQQQVLDAMEAQQQIVDAENLELLAKQSRFVEHLRENEEILKRYGVELEPKRRAMSGNWLRNLTKMKQRLS